MKHHRRPRHRRRQLALVYGLTVCVLFIVILAQALGPAADAAGDSLRERAEPRGASSTDHPASSASQALEPRRAVPGAAISEPDGLHLLIVEESHGDPGVATEIVDLLADRGCADFGGLLFVEAPPHLQIELPSLPQTPLRLRVARQLLAAGWLDAASYAALVLGFRVVGVDADEHRDRRRDELIPLLGGIARARQRERLVITTNEAELFRLEQLLMAATHTVAIAEAPGGSAPSVNDRDPLQDCDVLVTSARGESAPELLRLWQQQQPALRALVQMQAARTSAEAAVECIVSPGDVDIAARIEAALRANRLRNGVVLCGTRHSSGVGAAFAARGHGWSVFRPRGLAIASRRASTGFDEAGLLRDLPTLAHADRARELQAVYCVLAAAEALAAGRAPTEAVAGNVAVESVDPLPGWPERRSEAMLVHLRTSTGRADAALTPVRAFDRAGLQLGRVTLDFLPTALGGQLAALRLPSGRNGQAGLRCWMDLARAARRWPPRTAAMSFFHDAVGRLRALALDRDGCIRELGEPAARLGASWQRLVGLEGMPTRGFAAQLAEDLAACTQQLLGKGGGKMIVRVDGDIDGWERIALTQRPRDVDLVLCVPEQRGRPPTPVAEIAEKLGAATEWRRDSDGRIDNLYLLLSRRDVSALDDAEWQQLVASLEALLPPGRLLHDPSRSTARAFLALAASDRQSVVLLAAHSVSATEAHPAGLDLGSGERLTVEDIVAARGIGWLESAVGTCRLAQLGDGQAARAMAGADGGFVSVSPVDRTERSLASALRRLLQVLQQDGLRQLTIHELLRLLHGGSDSEPLPWILLGTTMPDDPGARNVPHGRAASARRLQPGPQPAGIGPCC